MTNMATQGAWVSGTWGELIQGEIRGQRLLISLPSRLGSYARVQIRRRINGDAPVLINDNKTKSRKAVEKLLHMFQEQNVQVKLRISSSLRVGMGHGSSSADILSALQATTLALGKTISKRWLCQIASEIEPTNPCIIEGACLFDPDRGDIWGVSRYLPHFEILQIACGDPVDTIQARKNRKTWSLSQQRTFKKIMEIFVNGLDQNSPKLVAKASTHSALLYAERYERQDILDAYELAKYKGALGIAISYSGSSIVGLFQNNNREEFYV